MVSACMAQADARGSTDYSWNKIAKLRYYLTFGIIGCTSLSESILMMSNTDSPGTRRRKQSISSKLFPALFLKKNVFGEPSDANQ